MRYLVKVAKRNRRPGCSVVGQQSDLCVLLVLSNLDIFGYSDPFPCKVIQYNQFRPTRLAQARYSTQSTSYAIIDPLFHARTMHHHDGLVLHCHNPRIFSIHSCSRKSVSTSLFDHRTAFDDQRKDRS